MYNGPIINVLLSHCIHVLTKPLYTELYSLSPNCEVMIKPLVIARCSQDSSNPLGMLGLRILLKGSIKSYFLNALGHYCKGYVVDV